VQIAVLSDLIPHVRVNGTDPIDVAHVKGDQRMVHVIRRAVSDRQRRLREPLRVPYGLQRLSLTPEVSEDIVHQVRRQGRLGRAQRPDVQIVHFDDAGQSLQRGLDPVELDAGRHFVHRQAEGIAQQAPGSRDDDNDDEVLM